jgi:hypothetical protein
MFACVSSPPRCTRTRDIFTVEAFCDGARGDAARIQFENPANDCRFGLDYFNLTGRRL